MVSTVNTSVYWWSQILIEIFVFFDQQPEDSVDEPPSMTTTRHRCISFASAQTLAIIFWSRVLVSYMSCLNLYVQILTGDFVDLLVVSKHKTLIATNNLIDNSAQGMFLNIHFAV